MKISMFSHKNINVMTVLNKTIYGTKNIKGWSVVVMPDELLIDNYHHGYPHIHPDREKIKVDTLEEALAIVLNHIENNRIKLKKIKRRVDIIMLITLIREQKGIDCIKDYEKTYGSLQKLKTAQKKLIV
jgi:hypothetical protein